MLLPAQSRMLDNKIMYPEFWVIGKPYVSWHGNHVNTVGCGPKLLLGIISYNSPQA